MNNLTLKDNFFTFHFTVIYDENGYFDSYQLTLDKLDIDIKSPCIFIYFEKPSFGSSDLTLTNKNEIVSYFEFSSENQESLKNWIGELVNKGHLDREPLQGTLDE
ncbi:MULTISPECIES: hypothetical protein [unclassified Pseudoalteromonas]|uniref:hypothetical protein n=1 Tax=unclassified Pseudoalteromonas TaxID=194690 RepID=UPI0005A69C95|nr:MULTISPECIES: hypothetical protein [unclassified Pseudoalteromonas]